jgi:MoaA/NifB/PqqE/SkfB family radical SAM enzyme
MNTVFLVLTNRCPRKCPCCFYRTGYLDHPAAEMDTGAVSRALGRAKELGASTVIFTGGEPLIREDFQEILRESGRLGLSRLLLTSGGKLLDDARVGLLREEGLEAVAISVNSVSEAEELDRNAGGLAGFPRGSVTITTVFHRENLRDLPGLISWARDQGWPVILQPAFLPRSSPSRERFSPAAMIREEWDELETTLRPWAGEFSGTRYLDYLRALYRGGGARPASCGMGERSFVIDCDGSVSPCFHRRDLQAGNVLLDPVSALRESLAGSAGLLAAAPCYGEHCVSLFAGERGV